MAVQAAESAIKANRANLDASGEVDAGPCRGFGQSVALQDRDANLLEEERQHPGATGELSMLLMRFGVAGKRIAWELSVGGLRNDLGGAGATNVQGEEQKRLDVLANEKIFKPLGMVDTQFQPPIALRPRIAPTQVDEARGGLLWGTVHDENAWAMGGVAGPELAGLTGWSRLHAAASGAADLDGLVGHRHPVVVVVDADDFDASTDGNGW